MKTLLQILFAGLWLFASIPSLSAQEVNTADALISDIDKKVSEIEAFRKQHKQNQKVFIIKESDDKLALEETRDDSPDDETEARYYLLYDEQGRILSHSEVPTSLSGDWYKEITHYFGNDGQTIMLKNYSYHYNSGCAFLLNVTWRYYFDSQFRIIKKSREYIDNDNKPIADPSKCEEYGFLGEESDEKIMQQNYEKIRERINRKLIDYKIDRIKKAQRQKEVEAIREEYRRQRIKEDEEYERMIRREHIKDMIRSTLYAISALSFTVAMVLLITKKIKNKKTNNI